MKRYLAFFYLTYYPDGGMRDFVGSYNDLDAAIERLNELCRDQYGKFGISDCGVFANQSIYDSDTQREVWYNGQSTN